MRATLKVKIISGFAIVTVATVALGLSAARIMNSSNERFEAAADRGATLVRTVSDIQNDLAIARVYATLQYAASTGAPVQTDAEAATELFTTYQNRATDELIEFGDAPLSDAARPHHAQLVDHVSWFNKFYNVALGGDFSVPDESVPDPDMSSIEAIFSELGDREEGMLTSVAALRAQIDADAAAARDAATAEANDAIRNLLIAVAVVGVAIIAFGTALATLLVRRIRNAVEVLQRVAGGDLTARLHDSTDDEVGDMATALNTSISQLHDVIRQIESDADTLATLAQQRHIAGDAGQASATMSTSGTDAELIDMADNLNAMISIFEIEREPAPSG